MCGISGLMLLDGAQITGVPLAIARSMADTLVHRGPDSSGSWQNETGDVAFGHTRLAIVDLSEAGHQPMTSANGRWTITYNGELYNRGGLRDQLGLGSPHLRGHSDTEVLVEAIAAVGPERTVELANGMFAFAAHDRHRDEVWIARDRFGEKPLYHTIQNKVFAFASELRALRALPSFDATIDRSSLAELLERSIIRAPHSIYLGVSKLEAGSIARIGRDGTIRYSRYYDPTAIALECGPSMRTDDQAIEELEALLTTIVRERTIADVPLGAFLSGGVDSTMVVAMMQRSASTPTKTYTMGFEQAELDEAPAARHIADVLGTEHHEWIVTGADALAVVPDLGRAYDEPFADSSQIPTMLVSRFARSQVTVALSGDGGDELFGGYERYALLDRIMKLQRVPRPARRWGASLLGALDEARLDRIGASAIGRALPQPLRQRTGRRTQTLVEMLGAEDPVEVYELLMRVHGEGSSYVLNGHRRPAPIRHHSGLVDLDPIGLGMAIDTQDYLPNDILTKVDRASMAASLEVRAPLLDHRLHAFAWSLRPDQRIRDGSGKWLVREAVRRHVPGIADLPKRGFAVPLGDWLRGPLRDWSGDLIGAGRADSDRLFDGDAVQGLWDRHQAGPPDLSAELWPILMFQAWRAADVDS